MQTGNTRVLAARRGPGLECRLDPPAREVKRAEKKAGGGVGRVALQGCPQYRKRLRAIGKDVGGRLASGGMEIGVRRQPGAQPTVGPVVRHQRVGGGGGHAGFGHHRRT